MTLVDVSDGILSKAKERIENSLNRVVKKEFKDPKEGEDFVKKAMSHIGMSTDVERSVVSCDLVIEAIIENIKIKQELFTRLDKAAPSSTVFASNTSSLSITEIASSVTRKDRFGGLHFFNPVPVMELVEVIRTDQTSEETFQLLFSFVKMIN